MITLDNWRQLVACGLQRCDGGDHYRWRCHSYYSSPTWTSNVSV
jgi:hypothetical protein